MLKFHIHPTHTRKHLSTSPHHHHQISYTRPFSISPEETPIHSLLIRPLLDPFLPCFSRDGGIINLPCSFRQPSITSNYSTASSDRDSKPTISLVGRSCYYC